MLMPLIRAAALSLALPMLWVAAAHAADPQTTPAGGVLPPITRASDGTPEGWHVEDWQRSDVQVQAEQGARDDGHHATDHTPLIGEVTFIRLRQAAMGNTFSYRDVPIDPSWREVRLSVWARLTDLKRGEPDWKSARISVEPNANAEAGTTHGFDSDTAWRRIEMRHALPADGSVKSLRVSAGFLYSNGTLDIARPSLVGVTQAGLDAELAAMRVVEPADPSRVTGAQIDESIVERTIVVDAAATGAGDGSEGSPFNTFAAGFERAKQLANWGTPTKLLVRPGVYREGGFIIEGGTLEQQGTPEQNTLLVIQGAEPGKVILDGADEYAPHSWRAVKNDDGSIAYYEHAWAHDFGNDAGPWGEFNASKLLGHRREMIWFNGKPLKQVILEDYEYTPSKGWGGSGSHAYKGFIDPRTALKPGTFGVAERDQNGNKLFLVPPKGASFEDATIEVAVRDFALHAYYRSNLVLRGLTFRHTATNMQTPSAAVRIGHWHHLQDRLSNNNILIEDCEISDNGGFGMKAGMSENLTIRRTKFLRNGHSGINTGSCLNTVIEDVETSYNNWRGHLGGLYGWAVGGIKAHEMRDAIFRNIKAHGNLTHALWFDISNKNITIENYESIGNYSGLFLEISPGPFDVRNALIAHSTDQAILLVNAANVRLRDVIVYGAADTLIAACTNDSRSGGDFIGAARFGEPRTKVYRQGATTFENCVFVNRHADSPLIMLTPANPELYKQWLRHMLNARGNLWYSSTSNPFGVGYVRTEMADFEGWKDATGQDADSLYADPGFADPAKLDFSLSSNSPLKGHTLHSAQTLDPKLMDDIRAWFELWEFENRGDYDENPLR